MSLLFVLNSDFFDVRIKRIDGSPQFVDIVENAIDPAIEFIDIFVLKNIRFLVYFTNPLFE